MISIHPRLPEIPGLAERVQLFRLEVETSIAGADSANAALKDEREKLFEQQQVIKGRADDLRARSALDETAARQYQVDQTRLIAIHERMQQFERLQQKPDFSGMYMLVEEIIRHYSDNFREIVGGHFVAIGVSESIQRAEELAGLTDAFRTVLSLRTLVGTIGLVGFRIGDYRRLNAVLDRAVRGQIHIGTDVPENPESSNSP